jgi:hypothetical protein
MSAPKNAVLQYRAIERWDGKLPFMQGGDKTPPAAPANP